MPSTSDHDINGQSLQGMTPTFEQLLAALPGCSRDEKRVLLDRVLRELIGDNPEREYGLYNPDGTSYLYLVPTDIRVRLDLTTERIAELARRSKNPGKLIPFSEVIARLEAMEKSTQEG